MGVSCSKPLAAATGTARIESQAMFWSSPMVASWLNLIGLAEYVPRFLENGVDGPTLIDLRRDQFERCLGINNPLHEVSLRLALIDLKYKLIDYTQWEWNCTGVMQWLANRGLEQLIGRFQSAAVHGSVLFRLTKAEFASRLHVGELGESELVLESLWHSVERARKIGYYLEQGNFLDWGPPEIRGWLETINLGHLHEHFREHAVNGTLLPHLDHQTLRRVMKLTEIQTMVLVKAIRRLLRGEILQGGAAHAHSPGRGEPASPLCSAVSCNSELSPDSSPESVTDSGRRRSSHSRSRKGSRSRRHRTKENRETTIVSSHHHHHQRSVSFTPNFDENDLAIQI